MFPPGCAHRREDGWSARRRPAVAASWWCTAAICTESSPRRLRRCSCPPSPRCEAPQTTRRRGLGADSLASTRREGRAAAQVRGLARADTGVRAGHGRPFHPAQRRHRARRTAPPVRPGPCCPRGRRRTRHDPRPRPGWEPGPRRRGHAGCADRPQPPTWMPRSACTTRRGGNGATAIARSSRQVGRIARRTARRQSLSATPRFGCCPRAPAPEPWHDCRPGGLRARK
jgi:hypothetical protein